MINNEEKDLLTSLINCPTHKTTSIEQNQMNHNTSMVFNSNNSFYAQQTPTQIQQHRTPNSVPFDNSLRNSIFDDYLTPPSSNNTNFLAMQNGSPSLHSYMNISFRENQMMTTFPNTVTPNQHHYPSHQGPYPYWCILYCTDLLFCCFFSFNWISFIFPGFLRFFVFRYQLWLVISLIHRTENQRQAIDKLHCEKCPSSRMIFSRS